MQVEDVAKWCLVSTESWEGGCLDSSDLAYLLGLVVGVVLVCVRVAWLQKHRPEALRYAATKGRKARWWRPAVLCDACCSIAVGIRNAQGHPHLSEDGAPASFKPPGRARIRIHKYVCDICLAAWQCEDDPDDPKAGWSRR